MVAGVVLILALSTSFLSERSQQRIAGAFQVSVLRPFIATQERLERARIGAAQVDSLLTLVDSLSAMLSTNSILLNENRTLRSLLEIQERAGPGYLPATVMRPGTPGSESMFLIDLGARDGVVSGSPVVSPSGLVGVIREVRERSSVGIDWSHPEFRASAMVADGSVYGLAQSRQGRFREEDRLLLNGIPFNETVAPGALVVTSNLGGVFPRGIPIGEVESLADEEGTWSKSFWLAPRVRPGSATHVLVLTEAVGDDVMRIWVADSLAADSLATEDDPVEGPAVIEGPATADSSAVEGPADGNSASGGSVTGEGGR